MTHQRRLKAAFLLAAGLLCGAALIGTGGPSGADEDKKVTICHAAGQDGTTKYVTLTLSENAVFKDQGGHFFENGTPQAGHEDDYLGACIGDVTTTSTYDVTTTTAEQTTTTTEDNGTTTTTVDGGTTTTTEDTVPPIVTTPPTIDEPVTIVKDPPAFTPKSTPTPDETLPATGLSSTQQLALVGLGAVLVGAAAMLVRRPLAE